MTQVFTVPRCMFLGLLLSASAAAAGALTDKASLDRSPSQPRQGEANDHLPFGARISLWLNSGSTHKALGLPNWGLNERLTTTHDAFGLRLADFDGRIAEGKIPTALPIAKSVALLAAFLNAPQTVQDVHARIIEPLFINTPYTRHHESSIAVTDLGRETSSDVRIRMASRALPEAVKAFRQLFYEQGLDPNAALRLMRGKDEHLVRRSGRSATHARQAAAILVLTALGLAWDGSGRLLTDPGLFNDFLPYLLTVSPAIATALSAVRGGNVTEQQRRATAALQQLFDDRSQRDVRGLTTSLYALANRTSFDPLSTISQADRLLHAVRWPGSETDRIQLQKHVGASLISSGADVDLLKEAIFGSPNTVEPLSKIIQRVAYTETMRTAATTHPGFKGAANSKWQNGALEWPEPWKFADHVNEIGRTNMGAVLATTGDDYQFPIGLFTAIQGIDRWVFADAVQGIGTDAWWRDVRYSEGGSNWGSNGPAAFASREYWRRFRDYGASGDMVRALDVIGPSAIHLPRSLLSGVNRLPMAQEAYASWAVAASGGQNYVEKLNKALNRAVTNTLENFKHPHDALLWMTTVANLNAQLEQGAYQLRQMKSAPTRAKERIAKAEVDLRNAMESDEADPEQRRNVEKAERRYRAAVRQFDQIKDNWPQLENSVVLLSEALRNQRTVLNNTVDSMIYQIFSDSVARSPAFLLDAKPLREESGFDDRQYNGFSAVEPHSHIGAILQWLAMEAPGSLTQVGDRFAQLHEQSGLANRGVRYAPDLIQMLSRFKTVTSPDSRSGQQTNSIRNRFGVAPDPQVMTQLHRGIDAFLGALVRDTMGSALRPESAYETENPDGHLRRSGMFVLSALPILDQDELSRVAAKYLNRIAEIDTRLVGEDFGTGIETSTERLATTHVLTIGTKLASALRDASLQSIAETVKSQVDDAADRLRESDLDKSSARAVFARGRSRPARLGE